MKKKHDFRPHDYKRQIIVITAMIVIFVLLFFVGFKMGGIIFISGGFVSIPISICVYFVWDIVFKHSKSLFQKRINQINLSKDSLEESKKQLLEKNKKLNAEIKDFQKEKALAKSSNEANRKFRLYINYFAELYVDDTLPAYVGKYAEFIYFSGGENLYLFNPIAYKTKKAYAKYINANVREWMKLKNEYSDAAISMIKKEYKRPDTFASDTDSGLEKERLPRMEKTEKKSNTKDERKDSR